LNLRRSYPCRICEAAEREWREREELNKEKRTRFDVASEVIRMCNEIEKKEGPRVKRELRPTQKRSTDVKGRKANFFLCSVDLQRICCCPEIHSSTYLVVRVKCRFLIYYCFSAAAVCWFLGSTILFASIWDVC
jgi:hypothetical protein